MLDAWTFRACVGEEGYKERIYEEATFAAHRYRFEECVCGSHDDGCSGGAWRLTWEISSAQESYKRAVGWLTKWGMWDGNGSTEIGLVTVEHNLYDGDRLCWDIARCVSVDSGLAQFDVDTDDNVQVFQISFLVGGYPELSTLQSRLSEEEWEREMEAKIVRLPSAVG